MIRRPPRSTLSSSSAASDVYKRQYQRRVRGQAPDMFASSDDEPEWSRSSTARGCRQDVVQEHRGCCQEHNARCGLRLLCALVRNLQRLSLIHISEPTRLLSISYAVFCLKKKKKKYNKYR
eukprot:TRINITY_DN47075_c0_g1_i1.p1 TRINITY_DN47075_c0_g1~~TRINITY_DN47075_c0_g1_i1.p1  ORF type:complete len:121 (-),score=33.25 TRINITY_DN47075_c0_g1_i1:82-444(-)